MQTLQKSKLLELQHFMVANYDVSSNMFYVITFYPYYIYIDGLS